MAQTSMVSVRIREGTKAELEATADARGESRSALMQRYIEEGLRMDRHPGIVFRPGAAGRRAAIAGGPDVWEVIRVVQNADTSGEDAIQLAATWLGVSAAWVRIAVDYYADYRTEVDDWTQRLDAEAAAAEEAWLRRQAVLQ